MHDTIAIDFGTMRTKVSYFNPRRKSIELMRLGQDDRPFVPSLFYLGDHKRRLFGDDAAEYLDSDPLGFLRRPLKRELREHWVRAENRVKATPMELLTLLFGRLRERAREVPEFSKTMPKGVWLTIPAQYGPPDEQILKMAAQTAGFKVVDFVSEPVAAARAWLSEVGGKDEYVVVLDCGGGTLDWACLHRSGASGFQVHPELPPGGDNRIGGFDVDEALFEYVDNAISDANVRSDFQKRACLIRDQVRAIKEKYSRTGLGGKINVAGTEVEIPPNELENVINERFVTQARQSLSPYLDKFRIITRIDMPTVLLVGGSARLRGLQEAIAGQCRCNVVWWERSEYATVLGAFAPDIKEPTGDSGKNTSGGKSRRKRKGGRKPTKDHEVECPHCGEVEVVNDGTGTYICPNCDGDIEITLVCPHCREELEVEEWGEWKCPVCGKSFDSWEQAEVTAADEEVDCESYDVECPHLDCGEIVAVNEGTGTYNCPFCDGEIEMILLCPNPKCKEELEVEEWGEMECPECGESFDSWEEALMIKPLSPLREAGNLLRAAFGFRHRKKT